MLRPTDRILAAPARGCAREFIAWLRRHYSPTGPYADWTYAVQKYCNAIGMDKVIIWFQAAWETGQFTSDYWKEGNSGGMGIDADGWPTPFDINPNAGDESAMVHVATMWAMCGNTTYPAIIRPAREHLAWEWLEHVEHMVTDSNRPQVVYFNDLNKRFDSVITGDMEATWAWAGNYVTGICDRANRSGVYIADQSSYSAVITFRGSRIFHTVEGAVLRAGPTTTAPILKSPRPNQRFRCSGFMHGQLVHGSDLWLVMSGNHGWYVHASGVKEAVL